MAIKFSNNASGTLAVAITTSATTITLTTGQGGLFPVLSAGDYFYATLVDSSNNLEIVKVTARATDSLTVTRAQEGTTARAYAAGDKLELRATAATLTDVAAGTNISALPVAQGGTGAATAAAARANLGVVDDPGANGVLARTGANTTAARAITAGTGISVSNGNGVSGNPTITNAGVTGLTAGTGMSISASTGSVTVTNAGVTSFNGATGAITYNASNYVMKVYTTTGSGNTWTPTSTGLKALKVTVVGGGGNGGSATRWASGKTFATGTGGDGGGAGMAYAYIPAATAGSSQTVTVGAGGSASSFGTLLTATAGVSGTNAVTAAGTDGGGGSSSAAGSVTNAVLLQGYKATGGLGGNSFYGWGADSPTGTGVAGIAGGTYGGGGSGAAGATGVATVFAGGSGGQGIVIVEEFY